ncbi:hypothetical protein [Mucilaginibacter polytrichastri]|uniref:Uncharacterized protein n=1 Tax=Mucilaginibacter polytrichastri TaxID=1302689 RepID=A0A1Q6A6D4_9SPHI|nr:hypothetical protein [Mucilaginibacter polytrichastri]OKS89552.1 hypothetical protein RG47T_5036 [Mucilaginibacter polytrichastri]SFS70359.1 hypothetical protein SAMN04487890_10362 [Mucilaginibacter polytrichastri]
MKPYFTAFAFCAVASLTLPQHTHAQTKNTSTLTAPPTEIKIDGDLKEWGDSLRYYNTEKKLNYALANDKDNLYMAIRVNDRTEQIRIIRAGLTLSVNTKGKKKEISSITFPIGNPDQPKMGQDDKKGNPDLLDQQDRDEMMNAKLTKLRNIKVTGFPDIESDIITTSNTYGIKVALNIDADGYLNYEAAIPLKFFHAELTDKSEWAFNIKINGVTRPEGAKNADAEGGGGHGGGGRGGMGGGGMGGGGGRHGGGMGGGRGGMGGNTSGSSDHSELSKSMDFWEKYYLFK